MNYGEGISNFSKALSGLSKTLGIANQVIPLYQQSKPIFKNARQVYQIIKDFNKTPKSKLQNANFSSSIPTTSKIANQPQFFI